MSQQSRRSIGPSPNQLQSHRQDMYFFEAQSGDKLPARDQMTALNLDKDSRLFVGCYLPRAGGTRTN